MTIDFQSNSSSVQLVQHPRGNYSVNRPVADPAAGWGDGGDGGEGEKH